MFNDFLSQPPELIVCILSYIDWPDLSAILTAFPSLRLLLKNSQLLLYKFTCQALGVENNVHSNQVISQRLSSLKTLEEGWYQLNIYTKNTIGVCHTGSGIYDLTGGVYLFGDANTRELHICRLPSGLKDSAKWFSIGVNHSILDVGLCVLEHDLAAVVTTKPHPLHSDRHVIEINLLELSTGEPHPLASQPVLFVQESSSPRPLIGIEIVDNTLALIIHHRSTLIHLPDTFYILDWKTGILKSELTVPNGTYSSVIFLSTSLILLPNSDQNTLDVFAIPPSTASTTSPNSLSHIGIVAPSKSSPILVLALPQVIPEVITTFSARCEPNPTGPAGNRFSKAPFHNAPEDAIMILNILMGRVDIMSWSMYSMFVHRSALVSLVEEYGMNGSNPLESDERVPPVMSWGSWGPQSTRWFSADGMPSRWITTSSGQRCVFSVDLSTIGVEIDVDGAGEWDPPIFIADFNPLRVGRALCEEDKRKAETKKAKRDLDSVKTEDEERSNEGPDYPSSESPLIRRTHEDVTALLHRLVQIEDETESNAFESEIDDDYNAFVGIEDEDEDDIIIKKEIGVSTAVAFPSFFEDDLFIDGTVESRLPYTRISRFAGNWGKFRFAGVLMDEERLVGIRTNTADEIVELEVFRIGDDVQRWEWVE